MFRKAADGRLVVHVHDWSRWQGEPDVYSLHHVDRAALQPGGEYEHLGAECGFGRPLTLDEAIQKIQERMDQAVAEQGK